MAKAILFNTEMVRAILDGRKTCTRRVIELPENMDGVPVGKSGDSSNPLGFMYPGGIKRPPYQPGDILYVRETWEHFECCCCEGDEHGNCYREPQQSALNKSCGCYMYRATDEIYGDARWHPSIRMPKEAARIWLRVTDVRVERLQDITEEQAEQEGSGNLFLEDVAFGREDKYPQIIENGYEGCIKKQFAYLWDSTVKKSDLTLYGWDANPWVWVIDFEQCEKPNIII